MTMFEIRRYTETQKEAWDSYVSRGRNATFLFERNYMDYHRDRFCDHSLMFYKDGHLFALLPAHVQDGVFCSHNGLTYGGLIVDDKVTLADVMQLFEALNGYLKMSGFKKVIYRPVPWVYHRIATEEDLYAIYHVCHAELYTRSVGTAIFMDRTIRWRKDHRRRLKDSNVKGVRVVKDASLAEFWPVLEAKLKAKFDARPVHTLQEIEYLHSLFPQNIVQYNAYIDDRIVGGYTLYVTQQVLRGQYSATTEEGNEAGVMEAIYDRVMHTDYPHHQYYDFGGVTEDQGRYLNRGLMAHKEGFGGRAICYDTYTWEV